MAAHGLEVESFGIGRLKKRQRIQEVYWDVMDEAAHEDICECNR